MMPMTTRSSTRVKAVPVRSACAEPLPVRSGWVLARWRVGDGVSDRAGMVGWLLGTATFHRSVAICGNRWSENKRQTVGRQWEKPNLKRLAELLSDLNGGNVSDMTEEVQSSGVDGSGGAGGGVAGGVVGGVAGGGRVTLAGVAARCNVSAGAVSLALNHTLERSRLKPETYARIREVAREMGYRSDWRGRALAKGKVQSIGLLSARLSPHVTDVYEQMYDVIGETLDSRGYHMHFLPALGTEKRWQEMLEDQRVAGCLVVPPMPVDLPGVLRKLAMPAVLMNVKSDEPLRQLLPDDAGGMRLVMEHLLGLGHRRIAFYEGASTVSHHSVEVRREAFRAMAQEAGVEGEIVRTSFMEFAGAIASRATKVTAVISYKANYALELLHAFWRVGVQVPGDVSLATFDDSWILSRERPPVTAVSVPVNDIGRISANLIVDELEGVREIGTAVTVLPETLVVRESTAGPR